jgi:hypothetical protein
MDMDLQELIKYSYLSQLDAKKIKSIKMLTKIIEDS